MNQKDALEKQIDDRVDTLEALIKDSPAAAAVLREAVRNGGVAALFNPDVAAIAGAAKLQEMLKKGKSRE